MPVETKEIIIEKPEEEEEKETEFTEEEKPEDIPEPPVDQEGKPCPPPHLTVLTVINLKAESRNMQRSLRKLSLCQKRNLWKHKGRNSVPSFSYA